jgi:hypothetical protein
VQKARALVVKELRFEVSEDAKAMLVVIADNTSLGDLTTIPNQKDRDKIRQRITGNIRQGEQEMINQPMDDLLS